MSKRRPADLLPCAQAALLFHKRLSFFRKLVGEGQIKNWGSSHAVRVSVKEVADVIHGLEFAPDLVTLKVAARAVHRGRPFVEKLIARDEVPTHGRVGNVRVRVKDVERAVGRLFPDLPCRHRPPVFDAQLNCYRVPLTRGKVALIDVEDLPKVTGILFEYMPRAGMPEHYAYAACSIDEKLPATKGRRSRNRRRMLSHIIMDAKPHDIVVHLNDDHLDCRRANLRCEPTRDKPSGRLRKRPNLTSQYKGVHMESKTGKWVANISVGRKTKYLGAFSDEERAAEVYDEAARQAFGEFARLNFPDPLAGSADRVSRQ